MVSELLQERVFDRLSRADDCVSRLDERVASCSFAPGFIARRDFAEAVAWSWTQGLVTPLEDLVLHDQAMDVRAPDGGLAAAYGLVQARRKAARGGPELVSRDGALWLAGRRRRPPGPEPLPAPRAEAGDLEGPGLLARISLGLAQLEAGESSDPELALAEWLAFARGLGRGPPPLLAAAAMLEAWWIIDPLPRTRYVGALLVGRWLSAVGRVRSHVLGFETGLRAIGRGRDAEVRSGEPIRRVAFWLAVISRSAQDASNELHRLELARQAMARLVVGRRSHARAQDVMGLLLEQPVVTAPFLAERLGITQHGARRSLEELGSVVHEVSGRARYRAWRV
ncbi:DUF1612 domain-containing protein [Phenylobacterium sp. LjRoot164]|uniref:DUF1612 domain-containing protein n=1 Tax=unclassified Phenylobacterium TaxID=2640670 RepID=UPI003ECD97C4